MICFGVIGSGQWGTKVIHAIRGLGFDVKVCNRHGEFEGQKCASDYKEFIPTVDIVWVATHPPMNCLIANFALLNSKPTIVEKPASLSGESVRLLHQLSKINNVPLIVDYIHTFNRCVVDTLESKQVDGLPVRTISILMENSGPNRDYSPLWDYGSHALAAVLSTARKPILEINATCFEGIYGVWLKFDGEPSECTIRISNRATQRSVRFAVEFDKEFIKEYVDCGQHYPLQTLISTIARLHLRGEYFTNGDLAVEVTDLLERLHKMLPKENQ